MEISTSILPALSQRFTQLIWSCIDSDLNNSAVFYAERFFAIQNKNHHARHLYATALLHAGQTYSALNIVHAPDILCPACFEIKAKCSSRLGRHRQAREALDLSLQHTNYLPPLSTNTRSSRPFPDEAALHCRSGTMALKGNLPEKASLSFRQALALNPMLWEAFEGLCALGSIPDIDEIFPPRPPPIKRNPPEDAQPKPSVPTTTGAGFFTPDGNLFCDRKINPKPFRIAPPPPPPPPLPSATSTPRDFVFIDNNNENSFFQPDNSFHHQSQPWPHRAQAAAATTPSTQPQPSSSRPLSSADETGPVPKRPRAAVRQPYTLRSSKSTKLDEPLKKLTTSKIVNSSIPPRRSTRLLTKSANKPTQRSKHAQSRDRRRHPGASRSRSIESEDDGLSGEPAIPPSPQSIAHSPRSDVSPAPSNMTGAHEQASQEAYEAELAESYLYDLTRRFASAARALATYDCRKCLDELEQLPHAHQQSPWVLAMVGRAHYERSEYASAERAFKAVRTLEPYRLWDMEVYSSLLWHLQRNVQLSFLAQELLNINPHSAQAWIAVGNLFSLQKERSQALTCFRRATQMDPMCAYAYTLSGHESLDEDLDKAINFFQSALRADHRHYNAWYGLGTCYLRLSKIRLAEYHYRKAVEIHPSNAVLLGCVALTLERRGDRDSALALFDEAIRLSPDNALARYRRAKILIAMKKYQLAIETLESLRRSSPEESNVVFQLAKVYRLSGDEVKFTQLLAVARDISPKSVDKIKKLLETVKDEEGGDDVQMGDEDGVAVEENWSGAVHRTVFRK